MLKGTIFSSGYLFVRMDLQNNNWSKINNSYGVKHLLKMNDKPVPLSNKGYKKTILMEETFISC